ncbi:MAG TPA: hypothetical protein VK679_03430 [Gemmatimonadaceae bacterium]|nr:hypothetical protein [Gemmatimonadaceae bacterium]
MTALAAWRDGMRRVNGAPAVLVGVWAVTVLLSLPLTAAMRSLLQDHLGSSLAADSAASGVNYDWMQEFTGQASGIGATFGPSVIGFGAVIDNLSAFIDNVPRPIAIIGAATAYVVLWVFLAGGIIDRYARDRGTRAHGFFAASGVFFFRFLRLGALMGLAYGMLFRYLHPWLFGRVFGSLTHDLTVERTAFALRVLLYAVFGLALAACNILFDYAKVRAVVEDRRSMLGATAAGMRFLWRNRAAAAGLYLSDVVMFVVVLTLYAAVAPGAGNAGWSMWLGFLIGQLYVLARLWVKLVFWASEAALFQGRLAHAGYVAAPIHEWPDSPMADALRG